MLSVRLFRCLLMYVVLMINGFLLLFRVMFDVVKEIFFSKCFIMVCKCRVLIFLVVLLIWKVIFVKCRIVFFLKLIFKFLVLISVLYCLVSEVFGLIRMCLKLLVVSVCSLMWIGKWFCNFGIKFEGLVRWNVSEVINRIWLVFIWLYLVVMV